MFHNSFTDSNQTFKNMATTFSYYIRPEVRQDNTMAVCVRIIHNRVRKYLYTFYIDKSLISKNRKTIRDINTLSAVQNKVAEFQKAFLQIRFPEHLNVDQVVSLLNEIMGNTSFRLDIYKYMEKLSKSMEPKTAEGYRTAFNAIRRFAGDHVDINDITSGWVLRFKTFLETEPPVTKNNLTYQRKSKGSRAVSYYLGCLRHVHNMARLEFNDDDTGKILIPRQPFAKKNIVPKMPITEHRVLTVAQIRKIAESKPKPGSRAMLARDVFMLSFMLAGTNTIDLYELKADDMRGGLVTYKRAKTDSTRRDHALITLKVLPEAKEILKRNAGGRYYLLNFNSRYSNSHEFNRAVNKGLKTLAKDLEIEQNLQTYHARHSWGTIARNICGIDFDTVNAGLNHARQGSDRIADIYIERDYTAIWAAQEKVMEEVRNAAISENITKISKIG